MGAIGNSEKRKTTRDHATKMLNTALIPDYHGENYVTREQPS
jgi:hypothetical protein